LLAGLVLPALLLATLAGFVLATLLTTLVLLAALLLLVLIVLVWIAHRLFLPVDFRSEDQSAGEAFVPGCHLTQACALWVISGQAVARPIRFTPKRDIHVQFPTYEASDFIRKVGWRLIGKGFAMSFIGATTLLFSR
jgi:hypothetical protein